MGLVHQAAILLALALVEDMELTSTATATGLAVKLWEAIHLEAMGTLWAVTAETGAEAALAPLTTLAQALRVLSLVAVGAVVLQLLAASADRMAAQAVPAGRN